MLGKQFPLLVLFGLALGCSCSDRPTEDSEADEEHVRLCTEDCEIRARCAEAMGFPEYLAEECMDDCMTRYFGDHVKECAVVAERAIECTLSRGDLDLCDANDACENEYYPFSVCRAGPEYWGEHDCDDKCPGECCTGMGK